MHRIPRLTAEAVLAAAALAMLAWGPIPQLAHYHEFADTRALAGVANAADVLSNLPFALVAAWGFASLAPRRCDPRLAPAWPGYALFLAALALTSLGSSYYHLAPDNARLLWDRLPIALACAGLLGAAYADTHVPPRSLAVTAGLALAGVASVLWWSFTEAHGAGDLRPYLLLQGAPLVAIPIWQAIHRSPRRQRLAFAAAIALYALAKALELADHAVFHALGFMSGHTMKHLLAAAASAVLVGSEIARVQPRPVDRPAQAPRKGALSA